MSATWPVFAELLADQPILELHPAHGIEIDPNQLGGIPLSARSEDKPFWQRYSPLPTDGVAALASSACRKSRCSIKGGTLLAKPDARLQQLLPFSLTANVYNKSGNLLFAQR